MFLKRNVIRFSISLSSQLSPQPYPSIKGFSKKQHPIVGLPTYLILYKPKQTKHGIERSRGNQVLSHSMTVYQRQYFRTKWIRYGYLLDCFHEGDINNWQRSFPFSIGLCCFYFICFCFLLFWCSRIVGFHLGCMFICMNMLKLSYGFAK